MLCLHISRFASAFLDRAKPVSEMEGSGIELHGGLPEGETPGPASKQNPEEFTQTIQNATEITMSKKIKAVIFDQDGLMFDTERLGLEGWTVAGAPYGLRPDEAFLRELRGKKADEVRDAFEARFGSLHQFPGFFEKKRQYSYDWIAKHGVPVKPGLKELLSYLKDHGCKLAVATASSRGWTQGNVKGAGVDAYFDAYAYGDMVEKAKPDPAIFHLAARMLKTEPENCMVLEDSFNGIRAAYNGGFHPVMVPDQDEPTQEIRQLLTAECRSLRDVIRLFEEGILEFEQESRPKSNEEDGC